MRRVKWAAYFALGLVVACVGVWGWFYWGWSVEQGAIGELKRTGWITHKSIGGEKWASRLGWLNFVLDRVRGVELLGASQFSDEQMEALGKLKELEDLDLTEAGITDAGMGHLKRLTNLKYLDLKGTNVTDAGLENLRILTKLERVNLSGTLVTDAGMGVLRDLPALVNLELRDTKVTDAGMAVLGEMKSLEYIDFSGASITDKAYLCFLPSVSIMSEKDSEYMPGMKGVKATTRPVDGDLLAGAYEMKMGMSPGGVLGEVRFYYWPGKKAGDRYFFKDGKLAKEIVYIDGRENRLTRVFYESGGVFAEYPYQGYQLNGTVRYFKENGELMDESRMVNGTGVLRTFPNPAKKQMDPPIQESYIEEETYLEGEKDGLTIIWKGDEGVECLFYAKDQKEGWDVEFDGEGRLAASRYFHGRYLYGVVREYQADGTLRKGFPEYWIEYKKLSEAEYRKAAEGDEVLRISLEENGEKWGREMLKGREGR